MTTTTKSKTAICNRCKTTGLTWKRSKKGRWYLAEEVYMRGYARSFKSTQPHYLTCKGDQTLNTSPQRPTVAEVPPQPCDGVHHDFAIPYHNGRVFGAQCACGATMID